jgi:hypothetical protein
MINVNIVNFITVGIIAVIAVVVVRAASKALGKASPV